jgi:peptidoglycan/xylan/chitin deacetylase (PgdA/CDA1 family)
MSLFTKKIKGNLSKLNFSIGRNPVVEKNNQREKFIPEGYKSVALISSDFELAWAWRYSKSSPNPYQLAIEKAKLERENIPKIVEICERYRIPITWLTVGHLFLDSCNHVNSIKHPDIPRLPQFENRYWKYAGTDWFEHDPSTNLKTSPEWYCPDLINLILDSKIKHEIGSHTFSHIDCRDGVCTDEVFNTEMAECKKIASEWGLELKSFVHPGHTIGNLDNLSKLGFTNYRTDYRNYLGYPHKHGNGLWEFEQTTEFAYRKEWSINYHIKRYITILKRAIKSNTVAVFWFHPSFETVMIDKIWPEVFRFLVENRDKIWITTHKEYIDWLNKDEK